MGGGPGISTSVPQKLIDSAKNQLKARGIQIGNLSWDQAVERLAEIHFAANYPYEFTVQNPKPPQAAQNTNPKAVKGFCNVETNSPGMKAGIDYYIDKVMLAGANVPKKMRDQAAQDLSMVASSLVQKRGVIDPNEWQLERYARTFQRDRDDDALPGNNTAVQVDGIVLYCITDAKKDDQPVQLLVMYYMAVYYEITSDTQNRRDQFEKDAIAQAKQITNTVYPIRDETELRDALETHCRAKFKEQFGYDYNGSPPNAITAPERYSEWTQNNQIHAKLSDSIKKWAISYCEKFGSMNQTFSDAVQVRLNEELQNILSSVNKGGVWIWHPIAVTVDEKSTNSKLFHGFVYYFTNLATTGQDYDVSLTYVLIMGVYCEVKALGQTVLADLYDQLIRSLPDLEQFSYLLPDKNTKLRQTLADLAFENAKILFRKNHGFDWKASSPRLLSKDEKFVAAYNELFDFNNSPTSDQIENKITQLFEDDATLSDVENLTVQKLSDDLQSKLGECVRAMTSTNEENQWQVAKTSKEFSGDKSPKHLKHYAVYLYVYGVRSTKETAARQFFIYYLSIITAPNK